MYQYYERAMVRYTDSMTVDEEKGDDENEEQKTTTTSLTCLNMFAAFFNAPKVTFITHTVSFEQRVGKSCS